MDRVMEWRNQICSAWHCSSMLGRELASPPEAHSVNCTQGAGSEENTELAFRMGVRCAGR